MATPRPAPTSVLPALALALALGLLAACGGTSQPGSKPPVAGHGAGRGVPATEATPAPDEVWSWPAPVPASVGMPATDADGVVAPYGHLGLVHLEPDGGPRWEVEIDRLRDVAVLLTADAVVAPTEESLVALDRRDGARRWVAPMPDRANTPVVAGGHVVATTWEGDLVAVAATDGRAAWSARLPGAALAGPATATIAAGDVVVATWDAGVVAGAGMAAFDPDTGRPRWHLALPGGGVSAPTSTGAGTVVAVAGDRRVHAVDVESGTPRWDVPTAGGAGSPEVPPRALGDGRVLVADRLGGLVLLAGDGGEQWRQAGVGAAVRGGPAGPDATGRFALPVDDGRLLVAGPGAAPVVLDPPGRIPGVALAADGTGFVVATREAEVNVLLAIR